MNNSQYNWSFSIKCAVCSFFANYVIGVFHPLEVIKTRLQSHDGMETKNLVPRYTGLIKGFRDIYKAEGLDGLYRGIHITMFTQAIANAIFFWIYEKRKLDYQDNNYKIMDATFYASTEASILCTLITQPMWVIKTRVLLNTNRHIGQFENIINTSKQVWGQSRIRGLYSGLSMNLILSLTGILSMYSYEGFKILYDSLLFTTYLGEKNFICGAASKLVTTFMTYPFTTIRTRLQQNQFLEGCTEAKYQNSVDVTWKMMKYEGIGGFYKGSGGQYIKRNPSKRFVFLPVRTFQIMDEHWRHALIFNNYQIIFPSGSNYNEQKGLIKSLDMNNPIKIQPNIFVVEIFFIFNLPSILEREAVQRKLGPF